MKFRNFKMVDYVVYGRGCFDQLDEILAPKHKDDKPVVFLLDHHFQNDEAFKSRIPLRGNDQLIIADVTTEPKTSYVDSIAQELKDKFGTVSGVIGIGGGSTLDLAKAVSIMMTNPGKAQDYQGWDLVNMTQHPEAVLAAEAGLAYAGLGIVTDHDAGIEDDPGVAPVTQEAVFAAFDAALEQVRRVLLHAVADLAPTR